MNGGSTRTRWIAASTIAGLSCVAFFGARALHARLLVTPAELVTAPEPTAAAPDDAGEPDEDEERAYAFRLPSGEPAAVTCEEARRIVAQVRTGLAYDPEDVPTKALAA